MGKALGKVLRGEPLSDGLSSNLKKSKKLYRLHQKTYQDIVKLFAKPDNIQNAEKQLMEVLKQEKAEENRQRSETFSKEFGKPIKNKKPYRPNSEDWEAKIITMPEIKNNKKAA